MIAKERQRRITRAQLRRLEEALTVSGSDGDVTPRIAQAMEDTIASKRDALRSQLAGYDDWDHQRGAPDGG